MFITILGCLGVTAGAHRLWAHRTYEATGSLRLLLVLFHTIAGVVGIWNFCLRDEPVNKLIVIITAYLSCSYPSKSYFVYRVQYTYLSCSYPSKLYFVYRVQYTTGYYITGFITSIMGQIKTLTIIKKDFSIVTM